MTAPVPPPSTRRLVTDLLAALVGCLVLGVVVAGTTIAGLAVWHHATADRDIPPVGPTCDYEVDPGSGAAGTGTERRRDHPLFPDRECVAGEAEVAAAGGEGGETWPVEADRSSGFLRVTAVSAVGGFVAGALLVAALSRWWLSRRRSAARPSGAAEPPAGSAEGREPGVDG